MHSVKRVEIIANSLELDKVIDGLTRAGVPGYTIFRNAVGKGDRRTASDNLEMTMLSNIYVISFCPEELIEQVSREIGPILKKFGGVCYMSDAIDLKSENYIASS